MSRCTLRHILTALLYAGVAIVLVPYLTGHTVTGLFFLLGGIGLALLCGFLRCYLTEGDCMDRLPLTHNRKPIVSTHSDHGHTT